MGATRKTFLRLRGTPSHLALSVRWGLLAPLLGVAIAPAQATDYYWDVNGILPGSGGPTPSGTWSTTDSTLSLNSAGIAAVLPHTTTPADRLFFSAGTDATGAYTVTVSGTQNIGRLTFQEGAVNLTGGTINLGAVSGLIDGDATPDSISAVLSGTNGVRFNGGTVTLNGAAANTYTGMTQVGGAGLAQARVNLSAAGGNAVSGNFLQLGGGNYTSAGFVTLGAANQINDTATVQLTSGHYSGSSIFSMNGFDETLGGIGLHHQGAGSAVTFRNGAATDATVTLAGSVTYTTASGDRTFGRSIQNGGAGRLNVVVALTGTGSQTFAGTDPTYTGTTTVNSGTLRLWNTSLWASNATLNGGTLELQQTSAGTGFLAGAASRTHVNTIGGTGGTLRKTGNGMVILSGANTYQGATSIQAGTLQAGSTSAFGINSAMTLANVAGATLNLNGFSNSIGSLAGGGGAGGNVILGAATLTTGGDNTSTSYAGTISGAGALTKAGAGTLALTGASTYGGATTVAAGTLRINGSTAASPVTANAGSTLGGIGTIGGPVTITASATLDAGPTAGAVGTLTMGALTLNAGSQLTYDLGQANVVGGPNNDLVQVNGNLTLGGVVNVSAPGSIFANTLLPGSYRLINYTGTLSGSAAIGSLPSGFATSQIQTVVPSQVNLIAVQNGVPVQFWDGADTTGNGTLNGGTGTWNNSTGNWTNVTGNINQSWVPGVGIFTGTAGIVTIAEPVSAMGLQFIGDGYQLTGAGSALTMVVRPDGSMPFVRVDPGATAEISAPIDGTAGLLKTDAGTLVLSGTNSYAGGTVISGGTLQLGNGGATGSIVGDITDDGALVFDRSGALSIAGVISGSGTVTQAGPGTTILSGANTYAGGTVISDGTLQVAADGNLGAPAGGLTFNGGTLQTTASFGTARNATLGPTGGVFQVDANTVLTDGGVISGAGALTKAGAGTLALTGASTYTGATTVAAGTLRINGSTAASPVTANAGSTLGGIGTLGGPVTITASATLDAGPTAGAVGTLTMGALTLNAGSQLTYDLGQANVVGGPNNDLVQVNGNLTLGGVVNVSAPGSIFANTLLPGSYRLINYTGTLSGSAAIGSLPSGFATSQIQTVVPSQVNLIAVQNGVPVQFWDGADTTGNGTLNGGTGTWNNSTGNWTNVTGNINQSWVPGVGIFTGTAGIVTIAEPVSAMGLQFIGDGYQLTGAGSALTMVVRPDGSMPFVRVDPGATAEISAPIDGTAGLLKTDAGTLVLSGTNSYAGGTVISGGTLQLGNGGATGSIVGDITDDGALVFDRSGALSIAGVISGSGTVTQAGPGTTILSGANTYAGGTVISDGTLQVAADGNLGAPAGGLTFNGGTLQTTASFGTARNATLGPTGGVFQVDANTVLTDSGIISGAGALTKAGAGTLALTGASTYAGGTFLDAGILQVAADGNLGAPAGGLTFNGGTLRLGASFDLAVTRAVTLNASGGTIDTNGFSSTVAQPVSGTGALTKAGAGILDLTGASTYTGPTTVHVGTLAVNGSITSPTSIEAQGVLAGNGIIFSDVTNAGTVAPGNSIGALTVAGNYVGNNGRLALETVLAGDGAPSDMLVVGGTNGGSATGMTTVLVTNAGGAGALSVADGIKVVNAVNGATTATDAFALAGQFVTASGQQAVIGGAYGYTLHRGGVSSGADVYGDTAFTNDWYLRSQLISVPVPGEPPAPPRPLYQPGVPIYESYANVLLGLNGVPTLWQRVGNRHWADEKPAQSGSEAVGCEDAARSIQCSTIGEQAIWTRIDGSHGHVEPDDSTSLSSFDINLWKLQAGFDGLLAENDHGRLVGSLTVHAGQAFSNVGSIYGSGDIDSKGYGFGGALTWYGQNGFYVDGQTQTTWYESDLSSDQLGRLARDNDSFGYALSVEVGKRIDIDETWTVTPQAQLVYSSVNTDDFTDPFGAVVASDDGDSLQGRLGLAVERQHARKDEEGKLQRVSLYGIANLFHEFLDGTTAVVSGTPLHQEKDRLWGGLGLGGTYNWADDKYSVYGEVSANTSLANFADSYAFKGTAGFRVKF